MKYKFPLYFSLLFLICIFSCNQLEKSDLPTKDSTYVIIPDTSGAIASSIYISRNYTPAEIYFALYRMELAKTGDTIPLKRIAGAITREELELRMKRTDILMRMPQDTLLYVLKRMVPKAIYGNDNRIDVMNCENEDKRNDSRKVAVLIEKKYIQQINDSSYLLTPKGKFQTQYNLCNTPPYNERFFNQELVANCTGVAISNNKIITAGHCLNQYTMKNFYIVFDYFLEPGNERFNPVLKKENVFELMDVTNLPADAYNNDFRAITVNKPIPQFRIAAYRTSGKLSNENLLHVIGSPCGLPLKLSDSAEVVFNESVPFFKINSDTYKGNSGSPVFNSTTHLLEGILVRGEDDFYFISTQKDCRTSIRCPEFGCFGEDVIRTKQFLSVIQ